MTLETIFACIGALVFAAVGIGIAANMVSYAHTMWSRFSARKWYRKGRLDEASRAHDFLRGPTEALMEAVKLRRNTHARHHN